MFRFSTVQQLYFLGNPSLDIAFSDEFKIPRFTISIFEIFVNVANRRLRIWIPIWLSEYLVLALAIFGESKGRNRTGQRIQNVQISTQDCCESRTRQNPTILDWNL